MKMTITIDTDKDPLKVALDCVRAALQTFKGCADDDAFVKKLLNDNDIKDMLTIVGQDLKEEITRREMDPFRS
jgi:hypothetical protein